MIGGRCALAWLVAGALAAGEALVAWDCRPSAQAQPGDEVALGTSWFRLRGTDAALTRARLLPPADAQLAAHARAAWLLGPAGGPSLLLAAAAAPSIHPAARRAAVLACGEEGVSTRPLPAFTLALRARLTDGLMWGGGAPAWELDGSLLRLGPGIELGIRGRGPDGRQRRSPFLAIGTGAARTCWSPTDPPDLLPGAWFALAATYEHGARARLWLDGAELALRRDGPAPTAPPVLAGPLLVGGDRGYAAAPIELAGFAVHDAVMAGGRLTGAAGGPTPVLAEAPPIEPGRRPLPDLDAPGAWEAEGATLADDAGGLRLELAGTATRAALRLRAPLPLPAGARIETWLFLPSLPGRDDRITVRAAFADAAGKRLEADCAQLVSTHIAPGNHRLGAQWKRLRPAIPAGAQTFIGLEVASGKPAAGALVHLRGFGLDQGVRGTPGLAWVASGFRDNFAMVAFNGAGGRYHADDGELPWVNLDNLVDAAKTGRPERLDLALAAVDTADRLVWSQRLADVPAAGPADLARRIAVPITAPGTYRIEARSYAAGGGPFFTTDWLQLVVTDGGGAAPATAPSPMPLAIEPDRPFGRFEPGETGHLRLHVAPGPAFPCELRWAVLPFSAWVPGRQARRPIEPQGVRAVTAPGDIEVPWTPRRSVELVVAELWQDGRLVDRAERAVGVRNLLAAPAPVPAGIPSLADLAGPGRNWVNLQFHSLEADQRDPLGWFARALPEARRLTPLVGFTPEPARLEPIPEVYDWDYLREAFDAAAAAGCRVVLYLAQKWPPDWAPVEFWRGAEGGIEAPGLVWKHFMGGWNYCTGREATAIVRRFNQQLARRFAGHPGLGAYYFEDEHIASPHSTPLPASTDPANRAAFGAFLRARYGNLEALGRAWGRVYPGFDAVEIPQPDPWRFPRRTAHADWAAFNAAAVEAFVLRDQVGAVRAEDPRRPIIVYENGAESDAFRAAIAGAGAMLANGGVHADLNAFINGETRLGTPGLCERMEPHAMWSYDPCPHGLDEMVFGMLALGGRGLHFQHFVRTASPFAFDAFAAPGRTGYDRIRPREGVLAELRDAERLHDAVGVMALRDGYRWLRGGWTPGALELIAAAWIRDHRCLRLWSPGMAPAALDGCRVVFAAGEVVGAEELAWLRGLLARGGALVLAPGAGARSLEDPDAPGRYRLLEALGVDPLARGATVAGIAAPHDALAAPGGGRVLVLRGGAAWGSVVPAALAWAGEPGRLAGSDDPDMQLHVLQRGPVRYLATLHRGEMPWKPKGPRTWSGSVRLLAPPPGTAFRVTELWNGRDLGRFTAAQLAEGIPAGDYGELEMKVFRVAPE